MRRIALTLSWTDPKTGLRATHTNFPIGTEPDCGPQVDLDPMDAQDVGLPDVNDFLASWLRTNAKGEVWLIVRDVNQAGDCYDNALVGQGTATFHYVDNDVFAGYPPGNSLRQNNNAWGYTAEGTLTAVSGKEMRYSGHYRIVWDPQGFKNTNGSVEVNLR